MNKTLTQVIGGVLSTTLLAATAVAVGNGSVIGSSASASAYSTILNANNSPTIVNEQAVVVDDKGVTWEYQGVQNYNNGHISLKNGGYFGVSPETNYGITGIEHITTNFTTAGAELWLLKSTDGIIWHEGEQLASGVPSQKANGWRYIRFYNYSDDENPINISSITIGYGCSGLSSTEDIDLAKVSNVRTSNILEAVATNTISPNSIGGQALSLQNGVSGNDSYIVVTMDHYDSWHEIYNYAIEFDYYHANNPYKPSIQLMNGNTKIGSAQSWDSKKSNYKVTDINEDWWHCELSINSMVAWHVDHGDTSTADKPVDGIRIVSSGNCIIDNLKIGSNPCELGNYNNPSYSPTAGSYLWIKTCWVGTLYSVSIADTALTRYAPSGECYFYVECLAAGTVDVTVSVTCGYNRRTYTITKTITIK